MSQSSSLQQFLAALALDPVQYATYVRQPVAAMQAAGLRASAQAALQSGSSARLGAHLAAEVGETRQAASAPRMMLTIMLPEQRSTRSGTLAPFQPLH
jgi:hypothetical protein